MDVYDPTKLEADAAADVKKEIGFFETHPKATAIGAFALGVVLTLLAVHIL